MVYEKVVKIVSNQLQVEASKITKGANFIKDLKADSLDIVDMIITFEEEFKIEIDDNAVVNIKTVGDIVDYIEAHK
ncbi:MAG: acyl carrier protein [Clostridia bacterium]|nr:acyl carrier protein [Clostridia bacterium]